MRIGDRVIVAANWSNFHGMHGVVILTSPHLMVRLDGDANAMRFGEREVARVESTRAMVAGD